MSLEIFPLGYIMFAWHDHPRPRTLSMRSPNRGGGTFWTCSPGREAGQRPGRIARPGPAAGLQAPARPEGSGPRQRARIGPAKALQLERRAPQGHLRLGPGLRAVLGSPARPDQAERRAEGQGAKIGARHIRGKGLSMSMSNDDQVIQSLTIQREIQIAAPIEIAFEAMLDELGPEGQMPGGKPFPMKIEPWP